MASFDELIGAEPTGSDRERLRSVHDLLTIAGPPPELVPKLGAGPTLAMPLSRGRRARRSPSRRMLVPAAAAAAILALIIGISTGGHGHRYASILMRGTAVDPQASGTLEILPAKAGKQPMRLEVTGLPRLRASRYVVYLVRNRRAVAPCGSFVVSNPARHLTVKLNSPYRLQGSDSWIVTQQAAGKTPVIVLQPRF